mmetsp:Transcript_1829/g.2638  ORF Transcript_1829/g.2638 Transcript_1829/m.2638 type:complete len:123 (+) Transcript_1829:407-775(+)
MVFDDGKEEPAAESRLVRELLAGARPWHNHLHLSNGESGLREIRAVLPEDRLPAIRVSLAVIVHRVGNDGVVLFTWRDLALVGEARPRIDDQIAHVSRPANIDTVETNVLVHSRIDLERVLG